MKRIKKIMVACDFSEYSKEALKYAAELAVDLKADLIVTNVINSCFAPQNRDLGA